MATDITVVCSTDQYQQMQPILEQVITDYNLPLMCYWQTLDKVNNKNLKQLNYSNATIIVAFDKNDHIIASLCQYDNNAKSSVIKAGLDWHKLQGRIVMAGRKSELLLQACKLTADSKVLDATAGFGHDSLILASSLSQVTMIEKNPVTVLLLLLEQKRMKVEKNWQDLIKRLSIYHADVLHLNSCLAVQNQLFDCVYLDPMFAHNSYQGAKVGKNMQVLHKLADPPSFDEEQALLDMALSKVNNGGRVVVKRAKTAPYLAQVAPKQSWHNNVVRFDRY